jgi:hypothetical protein
VAHADRTRDDPGDAESRSGPRKDPEPDDPRQKPAEDPSELDDPDSAAAENIERLRKLGRG